MKKTLTILLLTIVTLPVFSINKNSNIRRYAILVGANDGGDERAKLRYAETDAQMVAKVFSDIGGIDRNNSILLLNPTKSSIIDSFEKIKKNISESEPGTRTELLFYYSGHSDEDGLLIRESHFYYKDLKHALISTNADVKLGILDSCSSGAFTRLKGGRHSAPFLVDESIKTEGHAFITSAAEDEAAQESNRIGASFFTHFLVSALRGAADTSKDGKVSLHEAYSYASNETLARTETTQAGPQHASYDFRLTGSGDFVLTDLRNAESNLILTTNDYGRFFIRDSNDNLISEVNKKYGSDLKISVPTSTYTLIKEVDGIYSKQVIPLSYGDTKEIDIDSYESFVPERNVSRGNRNVKNEYSLDVPQTTAIFGWSTMDKVRDARLDFSLIAKAGNLNGFQLSLANLVVNDARGVQISPLINMNGGDLTGAQISALFNITGGHVENYGVQVSTAFNWVSMGSDSFIFQNSAIFNYIGLDTEGLTIQNSSVFNKIGGNSHSIVVQNSGIYNQSGNLKGVQLAGVFNISKDISGVQLSSVMNFSEDVKGLQASSVFNRAMDVYGTQISLINVADYVYGLQIGLVNISKDVKGLPIGLINISTEGIKNLSYRFDTNKNHFIDYQFGTSIFYHLFTLGADIISSDIDTLYLGYGFGFHIPISILYAQIDLSINNKFSYSDSTGFDHIKSNPILNLKVGLPIYKDLAPFVGTSLEFPQICEEDNTDQVNESYDVTDIKQSFFVGIRF